MILFTDHLPNSLYFKKITTLPCIVEIRFKRNYSKFVQQDNEIQLIDWGTVFVSNASACTISLDHCSKNLGIIDKHIPVCCVSWLGR